MIKDLIKLPVSVDDGRIIDADGLYILEVGVPYILTDEDEALSEALCTLINAQNADVGTLAEEYANKMYPKVDDHANVRMRQALRESLIDAVLYGSTLNSGWIRRDEKL